MWFKQVQLFYLTDFIQSSATALAEKLGPFAFSPCLPSMPSSMGWVSPLEDEDTLAKGINGCVMICLQIENKILPASVVNHALKEKIKQIELTESRKVRKKEKLSCKDDLIQTLLPRAFTKLTRLYAYIDTRNQWLVLNTISPAKTELFLSLLKKSIGDGIEYFDVIKPSAVMTQWLKGGGHPHFSIEKACLLQDARQQNRVIRCQQQDLHASSIQALLKDGCEVMQLALCWQDKLNMTLLHDFSLRGIGLADEDIIEIQDENESKEQKFVADFIMMSDMFARLIQDLLAVFLRKASPPAKKLALVG